MRELAGTHLSDEVVKSLWISRLPENAQLILAASNEKLDILATMADKINDLMPHTINATSVVPASQTPTIQLTSSTNDQIAALSQQVSELASLMKPRFRQRRTYQTSRNASPTRKYPAKRYKEPENGMCFYHTNFGAHAKKCSPPCNFSRPGN